uniref:Uncharacterized protein n=1 Tax=Euplotes harpa TaxID=151035 RepID=A0A7S3JBC4_9SPIT|mmetsp:Transcript_30950/g.35358  ORF Transcript_30950/g.35358 Transcript_30950/m.35358 type:complete len:110 (+) Transcript_30950:195-524(+)
MMPFIVSSMHFQNLTTPEQAKLQLARHWRHANKVRDPTAVDHFTIKMYERLLNIQQQDVWGGYVAHLIAPTGYDQYVQNHGFSFLNRAKYEKKSKFMEEFYEGKRQNLF